MKWCIAFPYAPNEPIRAEAFEIVTAFYAKHFPDIPQLVHSATPVGEPFLRAKTRNDLVTMAEAQGFDIVCLIDADTLIHPDGIRRMVNRTTENTLFLGKPFIRGTNLPPARMRNLVNGNINHYWPTPRFQDPGAAWIIRPSSWWTAGGMDEQLQSWGGEDTTFGYLFAAVGGTTEYDIHPAVKAEHKTPRWTADPQWSTTWEREAVCRHIWLNPHLAEEWLTVRHQPGIVTQWITQHNINLDRRAWRTTEPIP